MTHDKMTQPRFSHVLESILYSPDLDAAQHLYGEILGLERVSRVGDRHVFFRLGQGMVLIFNPYETVKPPNNPRFPVPPHGAQGPGHICLAADSDQMDPWRQHLEAAGIAIESDFRWPNGARSIYFRDPAGNSIEIAEPWLWTPQGPGDQ